MYGLSAGMQPLLGQSYGAKDEKSLKSYLKSGLTLGVIGGIAVFALLVSHFALCLVQMYPLWTLL